jgi:hypothetical protein
MVGDQIFCFAGSAKTPAGMEEPGIAAANLAPRSVYNSLLRNERPFST